MSPALVERYLAAARVISRSAVGSPPASAAASIYRVSPEVQQHDRDDRLPLGTRGGTLVRHVFPVDAEYEIKVDHRPAAPAASQHQLEITHRRRAGERRSRWDARNRPCALPVTGGPHDIAVTFFRVPPDLVEQVREPFENPGRPVRDWRHRRPPALGVDRHDRRSAQREGPGRHAEPPPAVRLHAGERRRRKPACARTILSTAARRAYRGAVDARAGRRADDVLRDRAAPSAGGSTTASSSRCGACSSAPSSCTASRAAMLAASRAPAAAVSAA